MCVYLLNALSSNSAYSYIWKPTIRERGREGGREREREREREEGEDEINEMCWCESIRGEQSDRVRFNKRKNEIRERQVTDNIIESERRETVQ